ncbi:MAG: PQQ-binding-like beta-propeller repeat protein [Methanophagales archaeon]|nr:PQQ-binding-like beta-propeller repeat protein [Methanophagales archaeon]
MKKSGSVCLCALLLACVLLIAVPTLAMAEEGENYPMLQYDAQRTGNVSGIAPETDTLLWQSNEKTAGCIQAGPIVSDGKVYISTWWSSGMGVEGNAVDALYCLDENSGEEIWNNTEVYGASTAAIADGKLFVGTHRGNITCVDATSGEMLWSKKIEENPSWYGVTSSPLVFDGKVFVLSFSDGTLHTFSFDGTELWNFSSGGEIFCYSSPSAYDNKLFFAGNDSGQHALYCLDLNTEEELWKFTTETEIRGSPSIWGDEGMVFFTTKYIPTKKYGIYAVDITTGEEIWNITYYKSSWASPALSNGKLYIGGSSVNTAFYCYDANDGTLLWKNEEMEGAIDSSPVVADGKVYFGTNEVDGTVYALDANSGSIVWNYTLYIPPGFGGGYNIASPPTVSERTLFMGVDNVGVLAFRDPREVLFDGTVTLINGTTLSFVPSNNASASYEVNATTDLGALNATGLAFNATDTWYATYGSFFLESIAGIENEAWPDNTWALYINDAMASKGLGANELKDGDNVKFYYCPSDPATYAYLIENASYVVNINVHTVPSSVIFDTGAPENPYPSIFGVHYGNITPSHDVYVTDMYTYSCAGTGGHSEEAAFYNSTTGAQIAKETWNGYAVGDYQYIEFDEPFVLHHGTTYNFVIRTGSYPQIHHKSALEVSDGIITCTNFTDTNGKKYEDWIPAIRLE